MKNVKAKIKFVLLPALVVLLLMVALPVSVAAQPTMPHGFSGTVTIGGVDAAIGTVVSARYVGVEKGTVTTTVAGQYSNLLVTGLTDGDTVQFFVNDIDTTQTFAFEAGATTTAFNLSVADTTAPTATTVPASGATGVAVDAAVTATFNEDVTVVTDLTGVTISPAVGASAALSGRVITITHTDFASGTVYTVTIPASAVKDTANNNNAEISWSFTAVADTTAPTATMVPASGATGVAVDATVTATFNEDVTVVTDLTGVTISPAAGASAALSGRVITITHTDFALGTVYTVTIPASAVKDTANNNNAEITWSFTALADTTAPTATLVPASGATGVAVDATVTATFDEDVTSVDLTGITIAGASGVSAALSGRIITIAHSDFAMGTSYTVTIPAGAVKDTADNNNAEITWSFTTIAAGGPTAEAGGPYTGIQGVAVTLTGSASGGTSPYTYAWDLDNDGLYDNATGAATTNTWNTTGTKTIGLKVTDSASAAATDTATVVISFGALYVYDTGGTAGVIDKSEASTAVTDYEAAGITKDEVLEVLKLYFS